MVIVGKLGSVLATALYLPPIIGFLLAGMGIQDIVQLGLIKGCTTLGAKFFSETRTFALIIVLMRAGISLKPREVLAKGRMTLLLSVLTYFAEFAVMMGIAPRLLTNTAGGGWTTHDVGLMSAILAALSPSLVIPGMLKMLDEKPSVGFTAQTVLNSAP